MFKHLKHSTECKLHFDLLHHICFIYHITCPVFCLIVHIFGFVMVEKHQFSVDIDGELVFKQPIKCHLLLVKHRPFSFYFNDKKY